MYRTNGDSNNNMSHSIHRSYGPQLSLENSSTIEEQCMRDDRYFNLLYKIYDNSNHHHGITHRIRHLGNLDHFNAVRSALDLNRTEIDKAWRSSLLDCREMDAELARIQRDYEVIENKLTRFKMAAQNDKSPKASDSASLDLNLVGSALTTIARSSSGNRDLTLNSSLTALSSGPRLQSQHTGSMTETHTRHQLPTIAELVRDSSREMLAPEPTFEQELRRHMETNSDAVSNSEYRCPICWHSVRQRKPASTICGHVFCSSCIKTALRTTCKCPVCQRLMTARKIFRIYI